MRSATGNAEPLRLHVHSVSNIWCAHTTKLYGSIHDHACAKRSLFRIEEPPLRKMKRPLFVRRLDWLAEEFLSSRILKTVTKTNSSNANILELRVKSANKRALVIRV
jgi:hypothetical protein